MTTNNEAEKSIGDELREAMAQVDAGVTDPESQPEDKELVTEPKAKSDRDDFGRFTPKKEAAAPKAAEEQSPEGKVLEDGAAVAGKWTAEKAPSSWNPKVREKWGKLDPDVRAEIVRREEAAMLGVRNLQEKHAPVNAFYKSLEPFVTEAKKSGAVPEQYIANVMTTERVLRTADLPTKFNAVMQICDQYGIPLRDIINQSVGHEVIKKAAPTAPAIPPELMQELQEMRNWRMSMETGQVEQTIESFAQQKEFFGDVKDIMADLLDMGRAKDLADAYDQAVWLSPEVREVMLNRQNTQQTANKVAQRQVRAASASLPANGSVEVDTEAEGDDIYSTVAQAYRKATTGRV